MIGVLTLLVVRADAQPPALPPSGTVLAALRAAQEDPDDPAKIKAALSVLPKVVFNEGGADRTYYVWQGDQLLTAAQVRTRFQHPRQIEKSVTSPELVILEANGQDVFWPKGKRALTYAIDKASFGSNDHYMAIVREMEIATADWVNACPACGLSFTHLAKLDTQKAAQGATFVVRYQPDITEFVAVSFFPNDPPYKRLLRVAPSFFAMDFSPEGVLRHELGHILGYRHEHIRDIAGCEQDVDGGAWRPITPYTANSVMHYMCGGGGSFDLKLRPRDISGHIAIYS